MPCHQRHHNPSQQNHNAGVEDSVAEDEVPRPNCWTKTIDSDHRNGKTPRKVASSHFPSSAVADWCSGERKPAFESAAVADPLARLPSVAQPAHPIPEYRRMR